MRVDKKEIVKRNIKYRAGPINLTYSKHSLERLKERVGGEVIIKPTFVTLSADNIYNGEVNAGNRLKEVTVKIKYNTNKYMYLAIVIGSGLVKSVWFEQKRKYAQKKEKVRGGETEKPEESRVEVAVIPESVGTKRKIFRNLWNSIGKQLEKLFLCSHST